MPFSLSRSRRKFLMTIVVGCAAAFFIHWGVDRIESLNTLEKRLENVFYDLNWQISFLFETEAPNQESGEPAQLQTKEDRIIVVDIDESSLDELGSYHQWPRSYHARVVDQLARGGAAAILFDILFKTADFGEQEAERARSIIEKEEGTERANALLPLLKRGFNADSLLLESVRRSGIVVAGATANHPETYYQSQGERYGTKGWFEQNSPASGTLTEWIPQRQSWALLDNIFPQLSQAAQRVGLVNVVADLDGVHRREPLVHAIPVPSSPESGPTRLYPVLALQAALQLMGVSPDEIRVIPEKEILLPPPMHLYRDSSAALAVTTPMVTPAMIRGLLCHREQLRTLLQEREAYFGFVDVASPVVLFRDSLGNFSADIADAESLTDRMVRRALGDTTLPELWDRVAEKQGEEELGDELFLRWDDEEEAVLFFDEREKEEVPLPRYTLEVLADGEKRAEALKPGEVLHLSSLLRFHWNAKEKELYSNFILFSEPVVNTLLALDSTALNNIAVGEKVALGDSLRVPLDREGNMMIRFRGPGATAFKSISYSKLLQGKIDPGAFQGKVFVLGSTASALFDIVSAPGDRAYPGIFIHTHLLDNLLRGDFLRHAPNSQMLLIILLLAIATAFLSNYTRPLLSIVVLLLVGVVWFGINFQLFADSALYYGIVKPILALLLTFLLTIVLRYIFEEREKRHAVDAFKSYISPELIDQMLESETRPTLGGEKREITAFFSDIESFSTFSEKIGDPSKLVDLINEYLTTMTDTLMDQGGTLDKYIGDAIVAFFGAPMPLKNHARSACLTALSMQKRLGELRKKWRAEGKKWPQIVHQMQMRIGVNSGEIVTGNMGSSMRMNYTMMGDDVNLAARLESGAKQYGVYTVVSRATLERAGDGFLTRRLDLVQVMGKSEPVEIFELLATAEEESEELRTLLALWQQAIEHYLATDWERAEALFRECLPLEPNRPDRTPTAKTTPAQLYIDRCRHYRNNPPVAPGERWDGLHTATSK